MTNNEIIKALECCGSNGWGEEDVRPCDKCPMQECEDCEVELPDYALDLINRQKAEIAELKSELTILTQANEHLQELCKEEQAKVETAKQKVIDSYKKLKTVKTEAIREFAHFLIDKADMSNNINISNLPDFVAEFISREAEK